jgi:hypothetical protein
MNKLFATAAAIAVAGLMLAAPALAQQPAPGPGNPPAERGPGYGPGGGYGWGPGMMMGPGMMGRGGRGGFAGMCDPRAAGLAEWRMERIERLVKPSDTQRAALDGLRTASTKAAELISAACPQDFPASASARLEAMEKRMDSMLQAIKTVRPAFDAFYATLSDEQKARLNTAGPRGWGWRGWRGG